MSTGLGAGGVRVSRQGRERGAAAGVSHAVSQVCHTCVSRVCVWLWPAPGAFPCNGPAGLFRSRSHRAAPLPRRHPGSCGAAGAACLGLKLADFSLLSTQDIVSHNCVVIFSKTTCPYCRMAKELFEGLNVNYTAVELDANTNGRQLQDVLEQMTGGRTVPRVFINGTCVGGATDTQKLHKEGKLLPLINQCQMKTK
uniref:Glutaredoxin-2, mitochondrial n=1 Tax=Catharus ustulatus TaxID=91951 RepID=A0A8C3XXU4_CATUS